MALLMGVLFVVFGDTLSIRIPLHARFERRIVHTLIRVPFCEHFFLAREHWNRGFPNDKIAGFRPSVFIRGTNTL